MKIKKETKPWGSEEILIMNEPCTVKILTVHPGQKLSLQYHYLRKEFWKLIEGEAIFEINGKRIEARLGDEYVIEKEMTHRLIGGNKFGKILEISLGKFDKDDIVRLEDDYGRIK